MRKFFTENGHRSADPLKDGHSEGGTNGQAINEIVEAITQGDHPSQGANVRVAHALQPIASALRSLEVLKRQQISA